MNRAEVIASAIYEWLTTAELPAGMGESPYHFNENAGLQRVEVDGEIRCADLAAFVGMKLNEVSP